jgi:amidophosphoribosyltransferase
MNFFIMGFPAALDFVEGSGRAFEMGMICNHYIGRTFIQPSQPMRDFGVRVKLHPVRAVPESKKCWSCRGFHYPRHDQPLPREKPTEHRYQGTAHGGQLPADGLSLSLRHRFLFQGGTDYREKENEKATADFIGLDSIHSLSLDGRIRTTGLNKDCFCLACYTGKYPTETPGTIDNF